MIEDEPYPTLRALAAESRVVLVAGPPGVGKSLWARELAKLAADGGRRAHLLQWDVTRAAFEAEPYLQRFPEVDGVTHAVIRKAVGLWARGAVARWDNAFSEPAHLLIVEVPLVGNRLVELAQVHDDEAEALLAGPATVAVAPVPSRTVRAHIETARRATIAQPRHQRERFDAPPDVLAASWENVHAVGVRLGFAAPATRPPYDPDVYRAVYGHLLRHRHNRLPAVDRLFAVEGSVYDPVAVAGELRASPAEVATVYAALQAHLTVSQIEAQISAWAEL